MSRETKMDFHTFEHNPLLLLETMVQLLTFSVFVSYSGVFYALDIYASTTVKEFPNKNSTLDS